MRRLNVGALRSPSLSAEFPVSLVPKRMKKKTKKEKKKKKKTKKFSREFPRTSRFPRSTFVSSSVRQSSCSRERVQKKENRRLLIVAFTLHILDRRTISHNRFFLPHSVSSRIQKVFFPHRHLLLSCSASRCQSNRRKKERVKERSKREQKRRTERDTSSLCSVNLSR